MPCRRTIGLPLPRLWWFTAPPLIDISPTTVPPYAMAHDFDVVIIGSGFGGSVSALRLTEKGYRVAVLEAGRRFADDEFAETSWRLRRYLYAPALGCYGILRLTLLKHAMIM